MKHLLTYSTWKMNEEVTDANYYSQDVALVTLRVLMESGKAIQLKRFALSTNERKKITEILGRDLPTDYGTENQHIWLHLLLGTALQLHPGPHYSDEYIVIGDWPLSFKCKIAPKHGLIESTWKELGDWLVKRMDSSKNHLKLWLESSLTWPEFTHKYRGLFTGIKYGI